MCRFPLTTENNCSKTLMDVLQDEDMMAYIDPSNNPLVFYLEKGEFVKEILE